MASITSLPTELLLQIFEDEALTTVDLIYSSSTCVRLRDFITSNFKLDYEFQVDHVSQSAWELIRYLLLNPKIGEQFLSIKVTWHRRKAGDDNTWTWKWEWTEDELVKIYSACEQWGILPVYPAIEDGLDSEALLPLLLCYTTKLETFDLGDVLPDVVTDTSDKRKLITVYNHCADTNYTLDRNYFRETGAQCFGTKSLKNLLWTYSAFNSDVLLPGLANVKEFSHGSDPSGWPVDNIPRIFSLPRLKTLKLTRVTVTKKSISPGERNGLTKRLEMSDCRLSRKSYEKIARLTNGSLESFKFVLPAYWLTYYGRARRSQAVSTRDIAELFLRSNVGTLAEHHIDITVNEPPRRDYDSWSEWYSDEYIYSRGYQYDGESSAWSGEEMEESVETKTRHVKGKQTKGVKGAKIRRHHDV
ncbi:hypothetical protein TWF281_007583 [Arthrobotrys megalospora]